MQKLQYLEQPSMMDTKALAPSTRAGGRLSNFSISGKEMSTWGRPRRFLSAIPSHGRLLSHERPLTVNTITVGLFSHSVHGPPQRTSWTTTLVLIYPLHLETASVLI